MDKQGGRSLFLTLSLPLYLSPFSSLSIHTYLSFSLFLFLMPSRLLVRLQLARLVTMFSTLQLPHHQFACHHCSSLSPAPPFPLHGPRPLPTLFTNAVCFRNFCCMLRYFLFCLKILSLFMQSARFHPSAVRCPLSTVRCPLSASLPEQTMSRRGLAAKPKQA